MDTMGALDLTPDALVYESLHFFTSCVSRLIVFPVHSSQAIALSQLCQNTQADSGFCQGAIRREPDQNPHSVEIQD